MYNQVRGVVGGREVTVDPITMDFVDYQHLIGNAKPVPMEFLLFVVFREVEGPAKNIRQVHDWGRSARVIVEEVDKTAPDPTQSDQSPG